MEGTRGGIKRYSVPAAAQRLGMTPRGVRKRITSGKLVAEREGGRWFVLLPGEPEGEPEEQEKGTSSRDEEPVPDTKGEQTGTGSSEHGPNAVGLIALVRDQQQTIMELSGQVGFLQGQLAAAQEQIRLLQAPKDEPVVQEEQVRRGFWQRFLDRAYGR